MKFRKLRIAWSIGCGIVCLLLIVLWVRSHYWVDQLIIPIGRSTFLVCGSMPNTFGVGVTDQSPTGTWFTVSMATEKWLVALFENSGTPKSIAPVWSVGNGSVMMPYWFVIVVSLVISAPPWIRRFSLRTLLAATTLIAVVLGLVVYVSR